MDSQALEESEVYKSQYPYINVDEESIEVK